MEGEKNVAGPGADPELEALRVTWDAVRGLDEKALYRVTNYVESRHGAERAAAKTAPST